MKKGLLVLLLIVVAGTLCPTVPLDDKRDNCYLLLAEAFLDGRVDVSEPFYDVAVYKGRFYVVFPPFPAVLLMPLVAAFDADLRAGFNLGVALTIATGVLLYRIFVKLKVERGRIPWLITAFVLGTGYWYCLTTVYWPCQFAHIVAVVSILLALNEGLGKGRGVLVGLFLAMAFFSRQLSIFAVFFLLAAIWKNPRHGSWKWQAAGAGSLVLCAVLSIGLYLLYNWVRFENPFETGYSYVLLTGFLKDRVQRYGLFHPVYVPFNFAHMFLEGPQIFFTGAPTFLWKPEMVTFGTAITFASPFVLFAFRAKWERRLIIAAWVSICLMLIPMLFYYNNGFSQINTQRFTLDFLPILMILVALGASRVSDFLFKAAIVYSITLNVLALFWVPYLRDLKLGLE